MSTTTHDRGYDEMEPDELAAALAEDAGITATIIKGKLPTSTLSEASGTDYTVVLHCRLAPGSVAEDRTIALSYWQGSGHTKPPTAEQVLEAVLADCTGAGQPFADWAMDYGFDDDSLSAYRTWEAVEAQAQALRYLIGGFLYEQVVEGIG